MRLNKKMDVSVDKASEKIMLKYASSNVSADYDLVQLNGTLISTGKVQQPSTLIDISGLKPNVYILLVQEGAVVHTDLVTIRP